MARRSDTVWHRPTVPEYVEYGTGLALTTTSLPNGFPVELKRDPVAMLWTAGIDQALFGPSWELILNAFDNLFHSQGYLLTVDKDPQVALDALHDIVKSCDENGWL